MHYRQKSYLKTKMFRNFVFIVSLKWLLKFKTTEKDKREEKKEGPLRPELGFEERKLGQHNRREWAEELHIANPSV